MNYTSEKMKELMQNGALKPSCHQCGKKLREDREVEEDVFIRKPIDGGFIEIPFCDGRCRGFYIMAQEG